MNTITIALCIIGYFICGTITLIIDALTDNNTENAANVTKRVEELLGYIMFMFFLWPMYLLLVIPIVVYKKVLTYRYSEKHSIDKETTI